MENKEEAAAERPGEHDDEILVKSPVGQKVSMISPYEDGGEVQWLVPKLERDLEYFEIPWDEMHDEIARKKGTGDVIVLCRQPLSDMNEFDTPRNDRVFKSMCETFNAKHIINAIVKQKVVKKPEPIKEGKDSAADLTEEIAVVMKKPALVKKQKVYRPSKLKRLAELIYKLEHMPENGMTGRVLELIDAGIEKEKREIAERRRRKELRRLRKLNLVNKSQGTMLVEELDEAESIMEQDLESQDEVAQGDVTVETFNIKSSSNKSTTANDALEFARDGEDESRISLGVVDFRAMENRERILDVIQRRENLERRRRKVQMARAINELKERLVARLREEDVNVEGNAVQSIIEKLIEENETSPRAFDICQLIVLKHPFLLNLKPKTWSVSHFCDYLYGNHDENLTSWRSPFNTYRDDLIGNTLRFYLNETANIRGWTASPYYQFAVDSGLILASGSLRYRQKVQDFISSPDYEEKKSNYGNVLVKGVFSEEKMQELVTLGIAEQDPFLKDFLEFTKAVKPTGIPEATKLNIEVDGEWSGKPMLGNENVSEGETPVGSEAGEASLPKSEPLIPSGTSTSGPTGDNLSEAETELLPSSKSEVSKIVRKIEDEVDMKNLFGEHLFNFVWVHPKNFKRIFDEAKPSEKEDSAELQAFMDSWTKEWQNLMKSMVEDSLERYNKSKKAKKQQKSESLTKAFFHRLEKYHVAGSIPLFLFDGIVQNEEKESSYLTYLEDMKRTYLRHLEIDKESINRLIGFLKELMADWEKDKIKAMEDKLKELGLSENEGEDMPGEDDEKAREGRKVMKEKSKNFNIELNRAYTLQDLLDGNLSKGPIFIDKELKSLDEAQVKAIYKKNNASTEHAMNLTTIFNDWLYERIDSKKEFKPEVLRFATIENRKKLQTVELYQTLMNALKCIQHNPDELKFLFRRFEHYIGPEFSELHKKYMQTYVTQANETNQREKPYFSDTLLNAWKPEFLKDSSAKSKTNLDLVPSAISVNFSRVQQPKTSIYDQIYGNVVPAVYDQFDNIYVNFFNENDDEHSNEEEFELDPFACLKVEDNTLFKYDPYACVRNDPQLSRKGQNWYKSRQERDMRAFRDGHTSFFKYVDLNRLKMNSGDFDVWKMAASGQLFEKYEKYCSSVSDFEKTEKPEIILNENILNGRQDPFEFLTQELEDLKAARKNLDTISLADKKSLTLHMRDRVLGLLFKKYMPLRTYHENEKKAPPTKETETAETYIMFSTLKPSENQPKNDSRPGVDDNTLFNVMSSCGTLIFDITRSKYDKYVCCWYLRKLLLKMEKLKIQKEKEVTRYNDEDTDGPNRSRFGEVRKQEESERPEQRIILITNFMSWADSTDEVKKEMNAKNFYNRKPHVDYQDYYTFENLIYRIGKRKPFNISTTIVYTGLTFGQEEDGLIYVFKMAYENQREIPIYGQGTNYPPMTHVEDLSKVVASLFSSENRPQLVFAVQKIRRPLKKRIFNIAAQISYAHVRTAMSAHYEWNNILPKNVHDVLQLNVKAKHVDLHPLMRTPKIPKPFSRGKEGYRLFRELKTSRGIAVRTLLLIGAPSKIKCDLAKAISVLYQIPLLTRRNIMHEWLKVRQYLQEMNALRKGPQEQTEEKEKPKPSFTLDEVKQVVAEKNCDVNRHWLLIHLKMLLRTIRYRKVGYVLCDTPMSEKDAEFLFNNRPYRPEPKRFHDISVFTRTPAHVIFLEMNEFDNHRCFDPDVEEALADDWDDFWKYHHAKADAMMFFKRRLRLVHRLSAYDEFILQKVVEIMGPPPRPGGEEIFEKFLREKKDCVEAKSKQKDRIFQTFDKMIKQGLDSTVGVTHYPFPISLNTNCLPLDQNVHKYYLHHSPNYKGGLIKLRTGAAPYKALRRKWRDSSDLFDRIASSGAAPTWEKSRRLWDPKKDNIQYSLPYS